MKKNLKAGDVMSSPVTMLDYETTLRDAANILTERGISGAPVLDHRGKAVGVISLFDIVSQIAGFERPAGEPGGFYRYAYPKAADIEERWDRELDEEQGNPMRETAVGEIMTPELIGVASADSLDEVAAKMHENHIHRIFVMKDGVPEGVISSMDVLGAISG